MDNDSNQQCSTASSQSEVNTATWCLQSPFDPVAHGLDIMDNDPNQQCSTASSQSEVNNAPWCFQSTFHPAALGLDLMDNDPNQQCSTASSQSEVNNAPWCFQSPFDPVAHGLDPSFRLTNFSILVGNECKREGSNQDAEKEQSQFMIMTTTSFGYIHCSITQTKHDGLYIVQATDFLHPLCDHPYLVGRITCAGILGGLYATGVTECDNMLMLLSVSNKMTAVERDAVIPFIIEGFKDCASEAGTRITYGECVENPWLIIGGVATTVCRITELVDTKKAAVGDFLVLTKPLGTQVAVNAYKWLDVPESWNRIKKVIAKNHVQKAYQRALSVMCRLNRIACLLMQHYHAHAVTEVTGLGLLAHATTLVKMQENEVSLVIYTLPVIARMAMLSEACGDAFRLLQGQSVETSGGLLICLPRVRAVAFCEDIKRLEGFESYIIGLVEKGNRTARIVDKPRVLEVPAEEKEGELW